MAYATRQHLVDRFGEDILAQLTDRIDGRVIDDAVLERALVDADSQIDSYLAKRYRLPLAVVPPLLVRLACDIARYLLAEASVGSDVRTRYDDAVRALKAIAAGESRLDGGQEESMAPATGGNEAIFIPASRPRVFGGN